MNQRFSSYFKWHHYVDIYGCVIVVNAYILHTLCMKLKVNKIIKGKYVSKKKRKNFLQIIENNISLVQLYAN